MNNVQDAITFARNHRTFTHFLTANDTGATGGHQSGILISKRAWALIFSSCPEKGDGNQKNLKRRARIFWHGDPELETDSVFTYYRRGSRNEYRLTRFGNNFDRLAPDRTGDLFILCLESTQTDTWIYHAWTLQTDEDIEAFLDAFGMGPGDTNNLLEACPAPDPKNDLLQAIHAWAVTLDDFPGTAIMAEKARQFADRYLRDTRDPDTTLTRWISLEYDVFRVIEDFFYREIVQHGFPDTETFLACAQTLLQRRKARAGKSLEKHLSCLFTQAGLPFSEQAVTELNKKPDFIFPGIEAYHNAPANAENIIVLGAKTTCKDRWRQVITEAGKVNKHYLFTLQQGISSAQLTEMRAEHVQLVIPKKNISTFPPEFHKDLLTTREFIELVKQTI